MIEFDDWSTDLNVFFILGCYRMPTHGPRI